MKQRTHYAFAMGVSALITQTFIQEPLEVLLWLCLTPLFAYVSLLPDYLDKYPCSTIRLGIFLNHCRHHSTHHPLTVLYFTPLLFLPESFIFLTDPLFLQVSTAWGSHLLLDALNPSGIPVGRQSVFNDHPSKHYAWKQYNREARRWRIAKINYDSPRANKSLSLTGWGFFLLSFMFAFFDSWEHLVILMDGMPWW